MKTDKLILDACCGPRMMWFDKQNPLNEFDEDLWGLLVESVTVYSKDDIRVKFKD